MHAGGKVPDDYADPSPAAKVSGAGAVLRNSTRASIKRKSSLFGLRPALPKGMSTHIHFYLKRLHLRVIYAELLNYCIIGSYIRSEASVALQHDLT